jgi:hypothetical protein
MIRHQFSCQGELPGVGLVADFEHGIGQQMLPFPVRLGGRVEEIEDHVPGRRDLGQQQLHRIDGPPPGRLERQFAEPFGDGFAVALGGRFDLCKLSGVVRVAMVLVRKPGFSGASEGA